MGYRIGVLQSSEMGYGVYKKLGFRHLCQIEYFYCSLPYMDISYLASFQTHYRWKS
jgi:hypothetical protein